MRTLLLTVALVVYVSALLGQSFSRTIDQPIGGGKLTATGDTVLLATQLGAPDTFIAGRLYPDEQLFAININGENSVQLADEDIVAGAGRLVIPRLFTGFSGGTLVGNTYTVLDYTTGAARTYQFGGNTVPNTYGPAVFADDRLVFFVNEGSMRADTDLLNIVELDAAGDVLTQRTLAIDAPGLDPGGCDIGRAAFLNGSFYLYGNYTLPFVYERSVLIRLDAQFDPLAARTLDFSTEWQGSKLYAYGGALYALTYSNDRSAPGAPEQDVRISKFDPELNLVWSRLYGGDRFPVFQFELGFANGTLRLTANTGGFFPSIYATVDPVTGDVLDQRGFDLFRSRTAVLQSGQLALVSDAAPATPTSAPAPGNFILTDPTGNVADCPDIASCLFSVPTTVVATDEVVVDTVDLPLPVVQLTPVVTAQPVTFGDGCFVGPDPDATFTLPPETCINDCVQPAALNNTGANTVEWTWTGPGVDTTYRTPLGPLLCPAVAGSYTLTQTIWLLGCDQSTSQNIEVADAYRIDAPAPAYLCRPGDLLRLPTDAPDSLLVWDHGPVGSDVPFTAPGRYTVRAAAGTGCADSATVEVRFLRDSLPAPLFALPADTTLCADRLPIDLAAAALYPAPLVVDGVSAMVRPLSESGTYQVGYDLDGCLLTRPFTLTADPCVPTYFLPSGFSPNRDGVNDFWAPLGTHIEWTGLWVYDRWGALRHDGSLDGLLRWDGAGADPGVYVIRVTGVDVRTGAPVDEAVSVTLVR